MDSLDEWKKEIGDRLEKGDTIPSIIKRCPQCRSLTLEFDPDMHRIRCTKCGFEENLPRID